MSTTPPAASVTPGVLGDYIKLLGALVIVAFVGWLITRWSPRAGGALLLALVTLVLIFNASFINATLANLRGAVSTATKP